MSRLMYYDEEAHQFFPVPDVQPEPMRSTTNGDRIRAMSDDELAEWIRDQIIDRNIGIPSETWLDWLRREAKE